MNNSKNNSQNLTNTDIKVKNENKDAIYDDGHNNIQNVEINNKNKENNYYTHNNVQGEVLHNYKIDKDDKNENKLNLIYKNVDNEERGKNESKNVDSFDEHIVINKNNNIEEKDTSSFEHNEKITSSIINNDKNEELNKEDGYIYKNIKGNDTIKDGENYIPQDINDDEYDDNHNDQVKVQDKCINYKENHKKKGALKKKRNLLSKFDFLSNFHFDMPYNSSVPFNNSMFSLQRNQYKSCVYFEFVLTNINLDKYRRDILNVNYNNNNTITKRKNIYCINFKKIL